MPYTHDEKSSGQLIRSADWNNMGHELVRLEADKVNRAGDTIRGPLTVAGEFEAGGDGSFGGELKVNGARLRNASGLGIIQMNANDWLRINPDNQYPGIALFKSTAIGEGGLAVGEWAQLGKGELKVTGNATFGADLRVSGYIHFGAAARQMIGLWNADYGIGIQNSTQYFRTGKNFAWFKGGSHTDAELNAGAGGIAQMVLMDGSLGVGTNNPQAKLDVNGDLRVNTFPGDDTTQALTAINLFTRASGGSEQRWSIYTAAIGGGWGVNPNAFEVWEYPATASRLQIRPGGNTILAPSGGNVGIGTVPAQKLVVSGAWNKGKDADSAMTYNGILAIKSDCPQIDFIDTDHNDWAIHVNSNKMFFAYQPWNHALVLDGGTGNVGMGTENPAGKLEVVGAVTFNNGNGFALKSGFMASGSLTIGSITTSYGGGSGWTASTAGLLLETLKNTEIAVHDSMNRVTSLMYYEGDSDNHITIGRNMGWGGTSLSLGNSDLYFTKTDHNHTGYGNADGFAAIENAKDHDALMILGRAHTGGIRTVKLWDYLQVNGNLEVTGNFMERLEVINCNNRGDWRSQDHPIMQYFRAKLSGKPIGTMMRAIQNKSEWRGHYWQGWVDADGRIRVIHNAHNENTYVS